jgi:hypothetical protein
LRRRANHFLPILTNVATRHFGSNRPGWVTRTADRLHCTVGYVPFVADSMI